MINKILLAVIIATIVSQGLKLLLFLITKKKLKLQDLIVTGSMPSSHTAILASTTTSILFIQGLSPLAIFAIVVTLLISRDAFGVRRFAGEEGNMIKKLSKANKIKLTPFHFTKGHTPLEVFVGLIIGIFCAVFVYLI